VLLLKQIYQTRQSITPKKIQVTIKQIRMPLSVSVNPNTSRWMLSIGGSSMTQSQLSAYDIAEQLAPGIVEMAFAANPGGWCHSLLFPLGYFEREVIETVEVVGGIRRTAVCGELIRIDFNLDKFPPFAEDVRFYLRSIMLPLLEGRGCVCEKSSEGLVILLREQGEISCNHDRAPTFSIGSKSADGRRTVS
jgi:hypothetical protein